MGTTIGKMFFAYGLTAIVAMSVAVLIKFMTSVLSGLQKPEVQAQAAKLAVPSAPAVMSGDETEIAAIAAAVYAAMGSVVRIVRIEGGARGALWMASGRLVHQTPHVLTRRPPTKAM